MKLEHRISFRWLILFALPTIFSSILANLYSTVDGVFVARYPDYIQAADCIANCGIPYTLVRTADLTESGDISYHLHHAGEKAHSRYVSRAAVAALIVKMIQSETGFGLNESIGITD